MGAGDWKYDFVRNAVVHHMEGGGLVMSIRCFTWLQGMHHATS